MQHKFFNADEKEKSGSGKGEELNKIPVPNIETHDAAAQLLKMEKELPEHIKMKNEQMSRINTDAQEKLREFRERIDSFFLTAKAVFTPSRECSLAITSFQRSRQNLGICLREKGGGTYNTGEVAQRTEHGFVIPDVNALAENQLGALKKLFELTEDCITDLDIYSELFPGVSLRDVLCLNVAITELIQGRIWLGEIIGTMAVEQQK